MLFLPALAQGTATVDLYRGAPLGNPGYWDVEDAYLDKAEPGEDHGGGFTVLGGDNRTILIRFGDLQRMVGKGRRVTAARLVLTPSGGDVPQLKGVTAVDQFWGEGPAVSFTRILANVEKSPDDRKGPAAPRVAATWTDRRAGIAPWPTPGTPGGTVVAATLEAKGKTVEIAGLAATVQGWIDRPWADHGLALSFGGDVEFFSSQSPSGRPRLVLTTEPVAHSDLARPDLAVRTITKDGGKWSATVENVGSAPSVAGKATWWTDGKPGADVSIPAVAPNETTVVAYVGAEPKDDPQVPSLGLQLSDDASTANDRLDVFSGGKPVTLRVAPGLDPQAVVAYWNGTVAPQSRFSFAPEGVRGRVRLEKAERVTDGAATLIDALRQIGTQLGLPSPSAGGDLYPGVMGYGDTRFEGTIPGKLALAYEPYPDQPTETALLEPTGLLSATDVGRLNDPSKPLPLPKITILRATDLTGRPLPGLELTLEQSGGGTSKVVTGPNGTVLLPDRGFRPDLSNGTIAVRAGQSGVTASDTVKAWRISDAFRRSDSPALVVDVRLDLPMLPLETGTNLADDKALTLSDGQPYALGGALPTAPESWVEVDLGRDRTIGEIALKPGDAFWSRYEIRAYATGGKPQDASLWAPELDTDWARRNRAEDGWLAYRAPVERVRFIRIVSKSGGAATLAGLRVVPVKLTTPAP